MRGNWFPTDRLIRKSDILRYYNLDDIEKKAFLEGGYFDAIQIGSGEFKSRLLIAHLNHLTVYMGQTNQSLERELHNETSDYIFLVSLEHQTLDSPCDGLIYGNLAQPSELVGIIPPGGQSVKVSPPGVTNLFWRIRQNVLMKSLEGFPDLAEWFDNLKECTRIQSSWLAERMRSDMLLALEEVTTGNDPKKLSAIDRVILVSITNAFALEFLAQGGFSIARHSTSSERFHMARTLIHNQLEELYSSEGRAALQLETLYSLASKRAIEKAFAQCVGMGPLAYSRVVRLNDARRKLMDNDQSELSIGDIAAEFGFWDWSGFTTHYRRQFGELPSETRKRADR